MSRGSLVWRRDKAVAFAAEHGRVTVDDVIDQLDVERHDAARLLSQWCRYGFLVRIERGAYGAAQEQKAVG